jgi:GNAT superfamily N-acetyltransferase
MRIEALNFEDSRLALVHETLLVPNFPNRDDLDSVENIAAYLTASRETRNEGIRYYALIAIDAGREIVGTTLFGLFAHPGFCLMKAEYTAVLPARRGCGVASALCQERLNICERDARQLTGSPLDAAVINLQAGSNGRYIDESSSLWIRLGFRLIDFDFVQLPLSDDRECHRSLLAFRGYTEHFLHRADLSPGEMKQIIHDCNYFRRSSGDVFSFPQYVSMLQVIEKQSSIPLM